MATAAPNLTALVGADVAAALMGVAGGLAPLAAMPACNVQVLGAKKGALTTGLSSRGAGLHDGFVATCAILQATPPGLRQRAARLVAAKASLMARVDAAGSDGAGATGRAMRIEVEAKIAKWQEPPPARVAKMLPVPDAGPKKRRGGRRARAAKERYGVTDVRRAANRVGFNVVEEEVLAGDELVGVGQLGGPGGGAGTRLRLAAKAKKVGMTKAAQKKYGRALAAGTATSLGGPSVAGTASSLAFTPVQGIELEDPARRAAREAALDAARGGAESYFSAYGGFKSALPPASGGGGK
jgi:U4/U6 small nuclear ribonucleoprotein PRP31